MINKQIVVFTDLDGTLLDHDTYSYEAALPCLNFISENNIPLIYTSSKTAIEIERLCKQSNFYHPYIAENGGILGIPENYFSDSTPKPVYTKILIGVARNEITKVINSYRSTFKFTSFYEMTKQELIRHTGLQSKDAEFANQRDCTEPLLWQDEASKTNILAQELIPHSLQLIRGGRFFHVMGDHDKATTMQLLIDRFKQFQHQEVISVALGDSQNDLKMLTTANYSILIPNPNAPELCNLNHANLLHADHPGPQGWNDSLLTLLKELIA